MAHQKLNLNINLDEIQYIGLVPDITDYKLEFITQKFQTTDPIWRTKIIKKNYLDEIQYTDVVAVAYAKTIN